MDLFTYLMNKNGHNLVDSNHMFEYLLNKTGKQKEATGTEINITDVTRENIIKLTLDKESTQDGTPTPENPVEVKTVKGYRNLFDKDNANTLDNLFVNTSQMVFSSGSSGIKTLYISIPAKVKTYGISKISSNIFRVATCPNIPENLGIISSRVVDNSQTFLTITSTTNDNYLAISYYQSTTDTLTEQEILDSIMITEGTEELPYVPYGNNYVYVKVSNGTDTNYYTIPLNNNEVAGIGDYKDELIVDSNGKCWLNKKVGKAIFDGSESGWSKASSATIVDRYVLNTNLYLNNSNSKCNYFIKGGISQNLYIWFNNNGVQLGFNFASYGTTTLEQWKEWLSTHNLILYQPLATPELIDLNYTVDIRLFKGTNTITNSDDMNMTLIYK